MRLVSDKLHGFNIDFGNILIKGCRFKSAGNLISAPGNTFSRKQRRTFGGRFEQASRPLEKVLVAHNWTELHQQPQVKVVTKKSYVFGIPSRELSGINVTARLHFYVGERNSIYFDLELQSCIFRSTNSPGFIKIDIS
jgi:hypothetical protein